MPKKLTIEEIKIKINKIHGDTIILDDTTYKNTQTKAKFIDKDFGEWFAVPNNILNGQQHKSRAIEKRKQTNLRKYGFNSPLQNKDIQIKRKQTWIKKYGVENPSQSKIIKIKKAKTTLIHHKVENPFQNKEIKDKIKQTNLQKYGVEHPSQSEEIQKKIKQTNLQRYGAKCPSKNEAIMEKTKQTNLQKYGFEFPLQNKEIQKKQKQTNLLKYGVEYLSQNAQIARKTAKSQNNSYITHNWATNEEQVCQGSWEYKVVLYLNTNKISYKWQPKVFKIPNINKTYRPDLYLIDTDTWIEIKGYFRKDALEKWNWFHSTYPNSDLWNKEKLKEMEIL